MSSSEQEKHYVYIDDGLYTGSRLRKDIERCIGMIPEGACIDIIFLVACSSGLSYSKRELEKLCSSRNISVCIHRWREICNNKTMTMNSTEISYEMVQECLWASSKLSRIPVIISYEKELENSRGKKLYYCFRNSRYEYSEGIFTSSENRDIVEKEFLIRGIEIVENIQVHKGMYPLGYNLTHSFGFGSFCATDLNISNTCPLVLWWGNVKNKGDELDCWYPLLPRRISSQDINPFVADWVEEVEGNDGYDDIFNICPHCGTGISIGNDGGNGFCIECVENH